MLYARSCLLGMVLLAFAYVSSLRLLKEVKGRPKRQYVRQGDINIGFFIPLSGFTSSGLFCGEKIDAPLRVQFVEAAVYAIDAINENRSLLPNIDLGFAILDDCNKEITSVSQALRFLPTIGGSEEGHTGSSSNSRSRDDTMCSRIGTARAVRESDHFDVVGVVGTMRSASSIVISNLLGQQRVPIVSFAATSDELDDKVRHPYFLRVVPSDRHQMRVILEFIMRQGWSYFSVLYQNDNYGRRGNHLIQQYAKEQSLCVATAQVVDPEMSASEYKRVVKKFLEHKRARVVVAMAFRTIIYKVIKAIHTLKAGRKLILIGSDGFPDDFSGIHPDHYDSLAGSFVFRFPSHNATAFHSYFKSLKPSKSKNPWFREFWQSQFRCSLKNNSCDIRHDMNKLDDSDFYDETEYIIDSVYVYAHALHRLLRDRCPSLRGREVRKCVTGKDLLPYLKNVSFEGMTGRISFDKIGRSLKRVYHIFQFLVKDHRLVQVPVREINASAPFQMTDKGVIDWSNVDYLATAFGANATLPPTKYTPPDPPPPRSVCSSLCAFGEMTIYTNRKCCWECRKCRKNDRLVKDGTACEECPRLFWPDVASNNTECVAIVPYHPRLSEPFVLAIMLASCLGVLVTIVTMVLYRRRSKSPLIRASNPTLSFLQLKAILLGYASVFLFQLRPSPWSCPITYCTFCLAFTSLYSPMLVKSIRIYRLWVYVGKSLKPLRAVGPFAQVLTSVAIICAQMFLCVIVMLISPPKPHIIQYDRAKNYAEVSCDFTDPGTVSFLTFNIAIILLCCFFAFKTRHLSDSFSESKLIYICACTALVIGISFSPTYMAVDHEYLKIVYLSLALLLNHSVALVVLFLTRLYAIYRRESVED